MSGYPKGFLTWLVACLAALAATGALLVPDMLDLRLELEMPWRLGAGPRMGVGAAHVAIAFLALVFVGALWALHMRRGWRAGSNRVSGAVLVGVWGALAVTGAGILYLGDPAAGLIVSLSHTGVGGLLALAVPVHVALGLWRRREAPLSGRTSRHRDG